MDEVEEEVEGGRPATPEGAPLAYYTALRLQVGTRINGAIRITHQAM